MDNHGNKCGASCSVTKKCPIKGCLFPALAAFLTIAAFEWFFYQAVMPRAYQAGYLLFVPIWRQAGDISHFFYVTVIRQIVMAIAFTCIFNWVACAAPQGANTCLVKKGAKVGFKLGVLIGAVQFGTYAYLPIPISIEYYWLVGSIVSGVLTGIVLGLYKTMMAKTDKA